MMKRRSFLACTMTTSLLLRAGRAGATGGLDIPTSSPTSMPLSTGILRVLLGSGQATPIDAGTFSYNGKTYRGSFSLAQVNSRQAVINTLPLEEYLYSVVPLESPASWPAATLQAQAIVARTFALRRMNQNRPYDVVGSERDQAYGGLASEFPSSTAAVNQTRGVVVRFDNMLASVSYMSCCGGHTEDAANIWGSALPYLHGTSDPYCAASPDYHWTREIPWSNVLAAFGSRLDSIGEVRNINLGDIDSSGRAKHISLGGVSGSVDIPGIEFRRALGPDVVRSLLLHTVRLNFLAGDETAAGPAQPSTLTVAGSGRGHGVGLCQWGACGIGRAGRSAGEILSFYFPGTDIGPAYS